MSTSEKAMDATMEVKDTTSDETVEPYRMTWRTVVGILALSVCWASSSFAVSGPNSAIAYMLASFPGQEANASWIANAGLFCLVTISAVVGASSDRYGKKWFLVASEVFLVIGSVVSGSANSVNTIIGGQAISGVGGAIATVSVASGLEIVPARYRPIAFGFMGAITASLGAMGGVWTFAACVQHKLGGELDGWRWAFYIQAILCGFAGVAIFFGFNPPPTRFLREQTVKQLISSIDFLGLFLLALGAVLFVIPLVWGGTVYAWGSAHCVPFFVVGPLVLLGFGLYEWKGRKDGLLHHGFFWSRNFPILLIIGAVDGMLLYATGVFIPNQIRALYTTSPLGVARVFACFQGPLIAGYIIFGLVVTKLRRFRFPLVLASGFTTLFCGLAIRSTAKNESYFEAMMALLALVTAAITIVPVSGIACVVPSYLIGTSNLLLTCIRAIGGTIGIAIFSAVYRNKAAVYLAQQVFPVLAEAKVPTSLYGEVLVLAANAPAALTTLPGITADLAGRILAAAAVGNAESYKYVWACITAAAGGCFVLAFFLQDVPERMDGLVESSLEHPKVRREQQATV